MIDKDRLRELAEDPSLIPGIYTYCDRWCQRCRFGARCLQFRMEQEEEGAGSPVTHDAHRIEFWERLRGSLALAIELLHDYARREGIELEAVDVDAEMAEQERAREEAGTHPCSRAALAYSDMVDGWFASTADVARRKGKRLQETAELALPNEHPARDVGEIDESIEVIRWYQRFVYAKIMRAVEGRLTGSPPDSDGMPRDCDGSAKIALIAIERSMAAWANLLRHFPEKEDETLQVLVHLQRLLRSLGQAFPKARAFVRPGFDG